MIDERSLLNWLRDYQFENYVKVGYEKEYNFIENLIKGIENEPKVGEWIPVYERLPDNQEDVLVTIDNRMVLTGWYGYVNQCWYVYFWEGTEECYSVTAWQPLPQPYKED